MSKLKSLSCHELTKSLKSLDLVDLIVEVNIYT